MNNWALNKTDTHVLVQCTMYIGLIMIYSNKKNCIQNRAASVCLHRRPDKKEARESNNFRCK